VSVSVFNLDVASLSKGRDVSEACKLKKKQEALSLMKHIIHMASHSGMCLLVSFMIHCPHSDSTASHVSVSNNLCDQTRV